MDQSRLTNQPNALSSIALRYPEKTFYLGQVFKHTSTSYKLVWFLALLSLLKRSDRLKIRLEEIFTEMAVVAWHPVCLFRLSLGWQDQLQNVIIEIQKASELPPNADLGSVRRFVEGSAATQRNLRHFDKFVPTRFLTPWFENELHGEKDVTRTPKIKELARASQRLLVASPYYFESNGKPEVIVVNETWRTFFMENLGIIQSFAEHHFAIYLQARNPNVPGVLNKLTAEKERNLDAARKFWRQVRIDLGKAGKGSEFRDIYSDRQLGESFSIDHFLPWSFVTHDLLWNLTPVEKTTNSRKNDRLPDLDFYLPRLARLHFNAIQIAHRHPKLLEDYTDCFKLDVPALFALGESGLEAKCRDVILPQAQIAINQGFRSGWRISLPSTSVETPVEVRVKSVSTKPIGNDLDLQFLEQRAHHLHGLVERGITPGVNHLPFFSLKVAAGGFEEDAAPEPAGWVDVTKYGYSKRLSEGMFVTQVIGESMQPTINDGSYCVFRSSVEGTRQGRILLVQKRDFSDPETGGAYTVKRYSSTKSTDGENWKHDSIQLIPDNPDRNRFPILLFELDHDTDLRVIAEFIQMLDT